jgi:hypothetical protein
MVSNLIPGWTWEGEVGDAVVDIIGDSRNIFYQLFAAAAADCLPAASGGEILAGLSS